MRVQTRKSGRGLPHSKTFGGLRAESIAKRLGVRQSSAALDVCPTRALPFDENILLIANEFGQPLFADWDACLFAEVIPDGCGGHGFRFFLKREARGITFCFFGGAKAFSWFE